MRVLRIHHVAFAHAGDSPIVESARDLLGLECSHAEAGTGFVERMLPVGDGYLQLLEATGDDGVVPRFVTRRGAGLHHVAFEVDDIGNAIAVLQSHGVRMIDATPRAGGMGTQIAFAHPSAFGGMLVEFVEDPAHRGTADESAT